MLFMDFGVFQWSMGWINWQVMELAVRTYTGFCSHLDKVGEKQWVEVFGGND